MRLTKLLLSLFILTLPLGQLGRLPLGAGVNLYQSDVLAALVLVSWLFYALAVRKRLSLPFFVFPLFLFSSIAFISLVNGWRWVSPDEWLVSSLYLWRFLLYASLSLIVWDLVRENPALRCQVVNFLILSGVVLAVAGFIQFRFLPDFRWLAYEEGWDPHKNRLLSTFFDPNFTGAYLVLSLSLVLAGLSATRTLPSFFSFLLLLLALIFTFSRSAWLMFGAVVGVFGLLRSRWLILFAVAIAFLAYFLIPRVQTRIAGVTDPADSAHFRILSWRRTWQIFREHPFSGVGFNSFRYAQISHGFFDLGDPFGGHAGAGSDSSLLLVLATTGIFGLFAFLYLLGGTFSAAWRTRLYPFSLAFLASLVGLLGESNFVNSLFYPPIMAWFWIMVGILESS